MLDRPYTFEEYIEAKIQFPSTLAGAELYQPLIDFIAGSIENILAAYPTTGGVYDITTLSTWSKKELRNFISNVVIKTPKQNKEAAKAKYHAALKKHTNTHPLLDYYIHLIEIERIYTFVQTTQSNPINEETIQVLTAHIGSMNRINIQQPINIAITANALNAPHVPRDIDEVISIQPPVPQGTKELLESSITELERRLQTQLDGSTLAAAQNVIDSRNEYCTTLETLDFAEQTADGYVTLHAVLTGNWQHLKSTKSTSLRGEYTNQDFKELTTQCQKATKQWIASNALQSKPCLQTATNTIIKELSNCFPVSLPVLMASPLRDEIYNVLYDALDKADNHCVSSNRERNKTAKKFADCLAKNKVVNPRSAWNKHETALQRLEQNRKAIEHTVRTF